MSGVFVSTDKMADDQWIPLEEIPAINSLVKDTLLVVFSHLEPITLLIGTNLTCKRWRNVSGDNDLWKRIVLQRWPELQFKADQPLSYKNFYITQVRTLIPCPYRYTLPRIVTPKIPHLLPHFQIFQGQLIAATERGKLLGIDLVSGRIIREIPHNLPPWFYVTAMNSFKDHLTLRFQYYDRDIAHNAVCALDPNSGTVLARQEYPLAARNETVDETCLFYRRGTQLFKLNYWTGETTELLPGKDHSGSIVRNKKILVPTPNSIEVYPISETIPSCIIPTKVTLFEAGQGIIITYCQHLQLKIWNEEAMLINSIDLKPLLKEDLVLRLSEIRIFKDFFIIHAHYLYYVNSLGATVAANHNSIEIVRSSLYVYSLSSQKITRTLDFHCRVSSNLVFHLGNLILREHNGYKNLQIFDLTAPIPAKSTCSIL